MNTKLTMISLAIGGGLLIASCKESSAPGAEASPSDQSTAAADPATQAHILYQNEPSLPVGAINTKTEVMSMTDARMTMTVQGREVSGTMSRTGEKIKTLTVDSDKQLTIAIIKDENSGGGVIDGKPLPESKETEVLHGKTIVLTKKDGTWSAQLKEGTPDPATQKAMDKMTRHMNQPDDRIIFGSGPRKVGDTWEVDPSQLQSFAGADSDKLSVSFKVTFESIKNLDGHDCAVIVSEIDIKGKTDQGMDIRMVGKVTVFQSLEFHTGLRFLMDGKIIMDGPNSMHLEGPMKIDGKATLKLP